jgi:hypothetical protein
MNVVFTGPPQSRRNDRPRPPGLAVSKREFLKTERLLIGFVSQ